MKFPRTDTCTYFKGSCCDHLKTAVWTPNPSSQLHQKLQPLYARHVPQLPSDFKATTTPRCSRLKSSCTPDQRKENIRKHGSSPPSRHRFAPTPHTRSNAHAWPSKRRQRRARKPANHARVPFFLPGGSHRRRESTVVVCVLLVFSVYARVDEVCGALCELHWKA